MTLLETYVAWHNAGVRSGDFTQLSGLFAPDAVMRFERFGVGPLVGSEEIAAAFASDPPTDELVLLGSGRYAWAADPKHVAGTLKLTEQDGLIRELVVTRAA